mmetsp:Transcript_102800/g.235805  ORF Transcript_102800/g.235805 Transcript_102800/m.235805 type:complete len:206 (+) Transcript_102800:899-1516(+)
MASSRAVMRRLCGPHLQEATNPKNAIVGTKINKKWKRSSVAVWIVETKRAIRGCAAVAVKARNNRAKRRITPYNRATCSTDISRCSCPTISNTLAWFKSAFSPHLISINPYTTSACLSSDENLLVTIHATNTAFATFNAASYEVKKSFWPSPVRSFPSLLTTRHSSTTILTLSMNIMATNIATQHCQTRYLFHASSCRPKRRFTE